MYLSLSLSIRTCVSKREAMAWAALRPAVYMERAWSCSPRNSSCWANSHEIAGTCGKNTKGVYLYIHMSISLSIYVLIYMGID